jgi:NMD protein affecting ribosome stability and mRNA decay
MTKLTETQRAYTEMADLAHGLGQALGIAHAGTPFIWSRVARRALVVPADVVRRIVAALRPVTHLSSVQTGARTTVSGRGAICPDCGRALLMEPVARPSWGAEDRRE